MLSTRFRRFWVLCVVVGLLTAVFTLSAQATPPRQEDRPSRTNIEDIPHYPLAEIPEAQYQVETQSVIPGSRVAFQSYRDDNWNIYVGNDDGSGQVLLTNNALPEIQPHLNRGNSAIVYASGADGHDYEIYRMNVDGNNKVALTNNEMNDVNPQWSPNGTRIVFESYRDGQAEIYVMNADGTSQARLTNHGEYDGTPSWSPDGSKIVFSSKRTGAHRIWVMNADGSGLVQLSSQAYSHRPHWSPDGSRIAYDADGNNDGWQELWVMNADGSNQRQRYYDLTYTDVWMGSWSPDGRYIAFTAIKFIYYQGNWYWEYAYLEAIDVDSNNENTIRLSQGDLDWYPRWQTNDGQPPVSQVHALGAQSPSPIPVKWSGTDTGGSGGVSRYDVQVKAGSNGTWGNWLAGTTTTSGQYPGIGGTTYYFRVRAQDRHYNFENWPASHDAVTTVEALPPQSQVTALPPFSRQGGDLVTTWGGHDPGGSGIATYDVQYRVNNSGWVNWKTGTTESRAVLPGGDSGETYSFRVRATDHAYNVANWSADSNPSTIFYAWGIAGVAYDNSQTPASNITVNASQPLLGQLPTDIEGIYGAYIGDESSSYTVNWGKSGYGNLPETVFLADPDAQVDVFLPPADNIIDNWGFEEGFNNWNIVGNPTPAITDSTKHSGNQAALLGQSNLGFTPPYKLSDSNGQSNYPSMVADSKGNIHVLWTGSFVYYAWQNSSGVWSTIETLSNEYSNDTPQLLIDDNETLHAIWSSGGKVYYAQKSQNGNWKTPENITIPNLRYSSTEGRIAVDHQGIVHAFIPSSRGSDSYWDYFYMQRSNSGSWSNPQLVAYTYGYGSDLKLLIDHYGTLHAIWEDFTTSGNFDIYYIQRSSTGVWSPLENLSNGPSGRHSVSPDFVIDGDGTLHLTWLQYVENVIYYKQKPINGNWSTKELLFQNVSGGSRLALAQDGQIHMTWPSEDNQIQYARRSVNGNWSDPYLISLAIEYVGQPQILTDEDSNAHVVWSSVGPYSPEQDVYYIRQLPDNSWSVPLNLSNSSGTTHIPSLVMDSGGYMHVFWEDTRNGLDDFYYAGPEAADLVGETALSQNFTIPVTTTTPTLSFLYRSGGIYSADGSHLSVLIDDGTMTELPLIAASQGSWTHYSTNLSDWVGETITLALKLEQQVSTPVAWAIIDEVTVGSTYPDSWVIISDGNAAPGQEVIQKITYSNRGGAAAGGVTLTHVLPAGMTYVSASIPPASTNPLVWHLPDLPAKSDVAEILVTVRVNANTPAFTTLTSTAVITTNDTELELLNNQAEGHIYTAVHVYLPAIFR